LSIVYWEFNCEKDFFPEKFLSLSVAERNRTFSNLPTSSENDFSERSYFLKGGKK